MGECHIRYRVAEAGDIQGGKSCRFSPTSLTLDLFDGPEKFLLQLLDISEGLFLEAKELFPKFPYKVEGLLVSLGPMARHKLLIGI